MAGELSNWSRASSGHCYFTLKDDKAEIPCVMWRGAADRLAFEPRVGDWVQGLGSVSVYERGGKYQFYTTALQRAGVGVLWERFLALKETLAREGLFDAARKRPLPTWPQRIGVVTSPTGAALQDMLDDDRPFGDLLGGIEVLFHQDRREGQHVPDVVEAVSDVVRREIVGRAEVDADEVPTDH